jgi:hypothetical protein
MEERQGNDIRAAELRNLCVQQRAEEAGAYTRSLFSLT